MVRHASRVRLALEILEDRLALSWAGVPPSVITPPSSAVGVALNSQMQASGSASISGNEVDYYTFQAPVSGTYRLSALTPNSNLDPVLGLFNANGNRLAYDDDISSSNVDSELSVNLTVGQRYYFGITNYSNTPGGSYTWKVAGLSPAREDTFEENDTLAQTANLGTLTTRRRIVDLVMADSADWFRFSTTGVGNTSSYVAINFQHSQGDLDLRLYDSRGTLLRLSDGSSNQERISLNSLPAGTYYIQIVGYRGARNPNYSLDINPSILA